MQAGNFVVIATAPETFGAIHLECGDLCYRAIKRSADFRNSNPWEVKARREAGKSIFVKAEVEKPQK